MSWSLAFRIRQRLKSNLWAVPLVGGVVGVAAGDLVAASDRSLDLPGFWTYSESTATTVLASIIGAMAALTGFVLTVSVLGVQMAAGTFSPRYMRLLYREPLLKALLAVLVGTLTYSFALLRQVEPDQVPHVGVTLAGVFVFAGIVLFLVFLDRFLHRLRPVAVAAFVGAAGRRALDGLVAGLREVDAPDPLSRATVPGGQPTFVVRSPRAGALQAIDGPGLVRFARANDLQLVLKYPVGDFVPEGGALVEGYGTAPPDVEGRLLGMVALGTERTIEQDPTFALRIMVDVAIRALSPAVNDPTTAVQVLNYLGNLLRAVGGAELEPDRERPPSAVFVPVRTWDEVLSLGVTEIREFGGSSVQVTRRLRALLEDLRESVPPGRRDAVEDELDRLDRTVELHFGPSPDRDLASTADPQGIGGAVTGRGGPVHPQRTI
jgi:uncharacterized membrane protein